MNIKKFKNERGSVTLFVLVAMLFFTTVLLGHFMTLANNNATQIKQLENIKSEYNNENIDHIYEETANIYVNNLKIGTYVKYEVSYKDMYTNYDFTSTDGWRVLDPGRKNPDGTYTGVKLVSTGIPAILYYSSDVINSAPWAGAGTNANEKAAEGLKTNFKKIKFIPGTTSGNRNEGFYQEVKGQTSEQLSSEAFIANGATEVHNLTLEELNKAREYEESSLTSTATKDGATGLFYLRNLNKYNYSSSISPYYWLASPFSGYASFLRYVINDGGINNGSSLYSLGVRPVVSLPDNCEITITQQSE